MPQTNIFANLPTERANEAIQTLCETAAVRIERIVSTGHCSPPGFWYDQDELEWVLLLKGAARLEYTDGHTQDLLPGDFVTLSAHCRHRVAWTTPDEETIWLAVFSADCD